MHCLYLVVFPLYCPTSPRFPSGYELIMETARKGRSLARNSVRDSLALAIRRQLLSSKVRQSQSGTLEGMRMNANEHE